MVRNKNFLIAEAGINHNGNLKTALKLVDAAKKNGADAIKFQTYITEKRINKKYRKIFDILKFIFDLFLKHIIKDNIFIF